jgi:F0F1-type ATP synthase assembly protein I
MKKPYWKEGAVFFIKVYSYIAAPIVISLFLGKYLDKKFNSYPWCIIALSSISFFIGFFYLYKETVRYIETIEKTEKE